MGSGHRKIHSTNTGCRKPTKTGSLVCKTKYLLTIESLWVWQTFRLTRDVVGQQACQFNVIGRGPGLLEVA